MALLFLRVSDVESSHFPNYDTTIGVLTDEYTAGDVERSVGGRPAERHSHLAYIATGARVLQRVVGASLEVLKTRVIRLAVQNTQAYLEPRLALDDDLVLLDLNVLLRLGLAVVPLLGLFAGGNDGLKSS